MTTDYIPTSDDAVSFYWRPGCPFCMSLERSLNKLGVPLDKRNIWDEPEAASFVRSVANGNETVPTIAVGSTFMVNPSGKEVVAAMAAEAPHLRLSNDPSQAPGEDSGTIRKTIQRILGDN